jgi:aryl-alcohol dehydrogenase-like predicted oxidoreductase
VIIYSPMGSGLLTGAMTRERIASLSDDDWRKRSSAFREPLLSRNLEVVERLKAVADKLRTTPGAVAVAWTLRNPAVDGAIVGFRRPDQIDPIFDAATLELDDDAGRGDRGRVVTAALAGAVRAQVRRSGGRAVGPRTRRSADVRPS